MGSILDPLWWKVCEYSFTSFIGDLDELCGIFCYDNTQQHTLEKQHGPRITEADYKDYNDLRHEYKQKCLDVVELLQSSDITF